MIGGRPDERGFDLLVAFSTFEERDVLPRILHMEGLLIAIKGSFPCSKWKRGLNRSHSDL